MSIKYCHVFIHMHLFSNEFKQPFQCLLASFINCLFASFVHFFCWDPVLFLLICRSSLYILDKKFTNFEQEDGMSGNFYTLKNNLELQGLCLLLLHLTIFTIIKNKIEKVFKVSLPHFKRTIINSLYVNINNIFMRNNCFPKQLI